MTINNNDEAIGKRIKDKRNELNLSLDELADACKVNREIIELWEKGSNLPAGEQFFKLKKALSTNIDYLKYGDEDYTLPSTPMGTNLITWLILLAIVSSIGIIFSGFSALGTKAPTSVGFSIILSGIVAFSVIYWMAAILNSILATRKTNEKILDELIKQRKSNDID